MSKSGQLLKIVSTFLLMVLTIISCNPKPREIILSFESIEQKEWSGSNHPYDTRDPGQKIISTRQGIISISSFVTDATLTKLEQINYDEYFVIFVFQGEKPSSGYKVNIERITQIGKAVNIFAQFNKPKPDDVKTDEVTSPYQIVQVAKNGGNWGQEITINLVVENTAIAALKYFIP